MRSAIEPLEGNKVKVSVSVDAAEFEVAVDAAFRKMAREVRIPGFRPGKAPRRILEARLGRQSGRSEALREALPGYYAKAIRDHDVDAIAPPQIDVTDGEDRGPISFDAVVEVRPHLQLVGYGGLRVVMPDPEVTEADIGARIDRLRASFGELAPADRPARPGDTLTVNLAGTRDGAGVASLTVDDYSIEVGVGDVAPEVDDHMAGARAGDILSFEATHPDGPVQLRVLVKEVQEKILPEVTDEWVSEASEFDTVQELRADIVGQLARAKRMQATMAMNDAVVAALVDLVSDEPPEAMVSSEIERRVYDLQQRLESQGASLDRYLAATGKSPEEVLAEIRPVAVAGVRADLALRAVAEAEGIDGGGEVLDAEMEVLARNYKMTPDALRAALESSGRMAGVRSDLLKRRALEWVVEHAELVSEEGEPIDRSLLARPEPATAAPPGATPAVAASAGPIPGLPTDPGQTDPVSPDRSESDHA